MVQVRPTTFLPILPKSRRWRGLCHPIARQNESICPDVADNPETYKVRKAPRTNKGTDNDQGAFDTYVFANDRKLDIIRVDTLSFDPLRWNRVPVGLCLLLESL